METLSHIVRLPFFLINLLLGLMGLLYFAASTSVGAWMEAILRLFGYRSRPNWLPAALGFAGYTLFGLAGPAYLGARLIGWPGAIAGPLLTLLLVAVAGGW
jgi:hypothetical protein